MDSRNVGVWCVQEISWKGDKARELGRGCRLLYSEANGQGRNSIQFVLLKKN